jgi:ABC-type multidrug transport system fused ATPase/permease subunit
VLLLYLSPQLSMAALGMLPPLGVTAVLYGRYVRKLQKEVQARLADANAVASERLSNLRTVRAFSGEVIEVDRYSGAVDDAFIAARRAAVANGVFFGGISLGVNCSLLAVLGYGALLVSSGDMSGGDLTAFAMYSVGVGAGFSGLSGSYADLSRSLGAADRLLGLMAEMEGKQEGKQEGQQEGAGGKEGQQEGAGLVNIPIDNLLLASALRIDDGGLRDQLLEREKEWAWQEQQEQQGERKGWQEQQGERKGWQEQGTRSGEGPPSLVFSGIDFRYPSRPDVGIFEGLQLEIKPGETVALVGASGSGKSSALGLIQRFYQPQAGSVLLDGQDIRDMDSVQLRRQIGMVAQVTR